MTAQHEIPSDQEVLELIAESGMTPSALLHALRESGHTHENTIRAIQRVFDRGLVELDDGARLVPTREFAELVA